VSRNQVFVRAQDANGRWVSADVLDLDEESFRAFTLSMLYRIQQGIPMVIMKAHPEIAGSDPEGHYNYRLKVSADGS
jgi:hypothetical protein